MSNEFKNTVEKLYSIQFMRGVAALLVCLYHFSGFLPVNTEFGRVWSIAWHYGYAGVDIFFVISGFIITYVTVNTEASPIASYKFVVKRFRRIFPLWWFCAAIMGGYFYAVYGEFRPPDRVDSNSGTLYFLKSLFLWPQEFPPILGVGWTLVHELLFYMLFAFCLLFSRRYRYLVFLIWGFLICSGLFPAHSGNHANNFYELLISPLNVEFLMGALVAIFVMNNHLIAPRFWIVSGIIIFLMSFSGIFPDISDNFAWNRVVRFGVPAAIIIAGLSAYELNTEWTPTNFLVVLGEWSYSLYLTHIIVLLALNRGFKELSEYFHFLDNPFFYSLLFSFTGICTILLATFICYRYIEQPLSYGRKSSKRI